MEEQNNNQCEFCTPIERKSKIKFSRTPCPTFSYEVYSHDANLVVDNNTGKWFIAVSIEEEDYSVSCNIPIKYCPCCGRKLN